MRSVVVIEDDAKVRREILQYLKELDVEDAKEFSSIPEFEKHIFASLTGGPAKTSAGTNYLSTLSPDAVRYINEAKFCEDKPFTGETTTAEISVDKGQILKVDVSKIFGRTVPELVANSVSLETLVANEFRDSYKALIEAAKKSQTASGFICAKNDKGEIWPIEAQVKVKDNSATFTFKDLSRAILKELGRIDESESEPEAKQTAPDLILFRGSLADDTRKWVTRVAALLKKANLWPAENRPRFIVLRYEEESGEKSELHHPFIDDLLFLPLDRLIFLQKLELAFELPKKVSPSFLFVQETNEPVEIAKRVSVERVNDLGLAMVNPVPLSINTPAHFYFRFPGQKTLLEVWAKVTHSLPHPEREGDQLIFFSFFGLNRAGYREIRQYLNRDVAYKPLLDNDPKSFEYNPDNIFLTEEQKRRKTVAVLDYDETQRKSTVDAIRKEIQNVDIVSEDTFFSFFKKYLEKAGDEQSAPPATRDDFYADMVSFLVSADHYKMQMPLSIPKDEDKFLGHEAKHLFSDQDQWMSLFSYGDTKNLLMECMHLVIANKRVTKTFELQCADGTAKTVNVEFILEEGAKIVRLNLTPAEARALTLQQVARIESLEAIVMDASLLPDDFQAFLNSIKDACAKGGISTPPGGPRIIVYAPENYAAPFEKFVNGPITGFLYKPLEIRRLIYLVAFALQTPYSPYMFENIGWKQDLIHAKIGKDAKLVEISEFGATIHSDGPLKPGTMLFLFKSIYKNAPDQNLCVRVYHSKENESEEGGYLNSLVYFGITDAFLKFTRSYIRDSYASKKAQDTQKS